MRAKVFMVFDLYGNFIRTRVITKDSSRYRHAISALTWANLYGADVGQQSCFLDTSIPLTPEHQAEDYDLERGLTSVLVATIDI